MAPPAAVFHSFLSPGGGFFSDSTSGFESSLAGRSASSFGLVLPTVNAQAGVGVNCGATGAFPAVGEEVWRASSAFPRRTTPAQLSSSADLGSVSFSPGELLAIGLDGSPTLATLILVVTSAPIDFFSLSFSRDEVFSWQAGRLNQPPSFSSDALSDASFPGGGSFTRRLAASSVFSRLPPLPRRSA
ncbi:unnamed protein product [Linum trigynum]|uniref:Uncharacterized protein n=1 Tax=Linum trigynum TaxID=586398 RepID=A0AAV2D9Q1_9ROSI